MKYKIWLFIAILIFVISAVFGWFKSDIIAGTLSGEIAGLEELSGFLASLPPVVIAIFIFIKNSLSLLLSFLLSPILCVVPIIALAINGALLGWISATVINEESLGVLLTGLLPHGVLELPAFIIGEAAALSFGAMAIVLVIKRESRSTLMSTIKQDVRHLLLALALLFVIGPFYAIIILSLLQKQTRDLLMMNLNRNLRYLIIALALLVPAALIEAFITPLLMK